MRNTVFAFVVVAALLVSGCATSVPSVKLNAAGQREFRGEVTKVVDGDTLVVRSSEGTHKVRMAGIDAPELGQPFGKEAKAALEQRVGGKVVRVVWKEADKYGRTVGDVYDSYRWVNLDMVFCGMAWHYKAFSKDARMASVEANVKAHGIGLWKQKDPVAPWDYRKVKGE